jgi:hypothetical protein
MSLIIGVDFDGTCVTHEFPKMGREIGAPPVLHELVAAKCRLILWTVRYGQTLEEAVQWFQGHQIPLWGINERPDQKEFSLSPKICVDHLIDDSALGMPLKQGLPGERPYVDWGIVRAILQPIINPISIPNMPGWRTW